MRRTTLCLLFVFLMSFQLLADNHQQSIHLEQKGGPRDGNPLCFDMPLAYYYYDVKTQDIIIDGGGVVSYNCIPDIAPRVIQNTTLNTSQYVIASDVTAGKSVDNSRTNGQVTVTGDIEYEIEHTGEVRFCGGFKVDKGVKFSVKPSNYNK